MFNIFNNYYIQEQSEKAVKKYLRAPSKYCYVHYGTSYSNDLKKYVSNNEYFDKKNNSICFNSDDYVYITQCAIPRLGDISFSEDTVDCTSWDGTVVASYCSDRHMSTNLTFDAIPFGDNKSLCTIQI